MPASFLGPPSAVDYNAAGSAGSNKGPGNPDYLVVVQARIDTFLVHNPGVTKEQIPADLVTASGSGLAPHISPQAARVQIARIAHVRGVTPQALETLVNTYTEAPLLGLFGPARVHVLRLNIALDQINP
ncbi:potassium-transporting ATPase subunit C [Fulvivirgaceae bacterium PWU37]|uniref:Potassium-transporting ATPase subunit C n=1 Tax=Dawidia soli TaxID=2782352 RepID=A0AAP2D6H5_9BACT|nr:potassium-transporting ATPase subunit C [Dawidia soli]